MYKYLLLLTIAYLLLGCTAHTRKIAENDYDSDGFYMWGPSTASPNAVWPFQARGEEARCSDGHYKRRKISSLLPSQLTTYKILSDGNKVFAYCYYYGEDLPGFTMTDWYKTVFNIYVDKNGNIYKCQWKKYFLYSE